MDALLAYCSPNFSQSDWTGQEVGFAFGKAVPVISILAGDAPKGLLEPVQAQHWIISESNVGDVADYVYERLKHESALKAKLSEALARKLKFAGSFGEAALLAAELVEIGEWTDRARHDIELATEVNNQMGDAMANEDFVQMCSFSVGSP